MKNFDNVIKPNHQIGEKVKIMWDGKVVKTKIRFIKPEYNGYEYYVENPGVKKEDERNPYYAYICVEEKRFIKSEIDYYEKQIQEEEEWIASNEKSIKDSKFRIECARRTIARLEKEEKDKQ